MGQSPATTGNVRTGGRIRCTAGGRSGRPIRAADPGVDPGLASIRASIRAHSGARRIPSSDIKWPSTIAPRAATWLAER